VELNIQEIVQKTQHQMKLNNMMVNLKIDLIRKNILLSNSQMKLFGIILNRKRKMINVDHIHVIKHIIEKIQKKIKTFG
jgi:hypothetical protein